MTLELLILGYVVLSALGLVLAALMFVFQHEQHRYLRSRLHSKLDDNWQPHVMLIVPCKGLDLGLESNLETLFQQRFANYELCFVVESRDDPAVEVIRRIGSRFESPRCRILVAGIASDCGQKVHNLIAATRELPVDVEVLAFADSDARPHRDWLVRLVQRLRNEKIGASTGYRWLLPQTIKAPNWIACGINSQVAGLMGSHHFNLVWGGAWAVRATTFRRLNLPSAWRGSLSDDLVVSRLIHGAGLKVAFEPHCMSTSPVEFRWTTLAEFVRRQFVVVRVYAPRWWLTAICASTFAVLWWAASVFVAILFLTTGGPWWLPAVGGATQFFLTGYRAALRARTMERFILASQATARQLAIREVLAWPVITGCQWFGLIASACGKTICWRGISYRLVNPSQTDILCRSESATMCQRRAAA